jgi:DNA invertase Pin-like site-specific DNA recombinase
VLANKAVVYVRRSTSKQPSSVPRQIERCWKLASEIGLKVVATFTDTASGNRDENNRLGLKLALKAITSPSVGYFIVESPDRLSRQRLKEAKVLLDKINTTGCQILYVDKPDSWASYIRDLKSAGLSKEEILRGLVESVEQVWTEE